MSVDQVALASWELLTQRIASEPHPRRRRNLELVEKHIVSEVDGDLAACMATMVADPVYHVWGATERVVRRGAEAVLAAYEEGVRTGKLRMSFELHRVIVDDVTVITEGVFVNAVQSVELPNRMFEGYELDPDAWYLVRRQGLVVWPIDPSGLLVGEDIYIGQPHVIDRRLQHGELPHLGPISRCL